MDELLGKQFGNYRLLRSLGSGGFADVYLGQHLYLHTQAAIKVLHTRLSDDDLEQFLREARTIAGLVDPHIVRVLDCGVEEKTPYLVMDYAPNGTLRQRHPKGSVLAPAAILPYVQQVAGALQHAHNQRFIHRDVKPENLLLGRNNDVLLSDFGIAIVAQSSRSHPTQEIAGTVPYMAPEQLQGHPRPASDQYALGVVAYEWLTGAHPFRGSVSELFVQHLQVPPRPPRQLVPGIPQAVEEVVLIALAKDPRERFGTVAAFATAFERACQGDTTRAVPLVNRGQPYHLPPSGIPLASGRSAGPTIQSSPGFTPAPGIFSDPTLRTPTPAAADPTIVQTPPHLARRGDPLSTQPERPTSPPAKAGVSRRTFVIGLAGTAAAFGGLTWLVLSQHSSGGTQANTSPPTGSAHATTPTLTASAPVGPSPTPAAIGTLLYRYTGHTDVVDAVAWSPDGKRVASGSFDTYVHVWDALTGAHHQSYTRQDGHVVPVAWSLDGIYIASGSNSSAQVWNAATEQVAIAYTGQSKAVWALAWSPDKKRIASGSADNTIQIWDALTGQNVVTCLGHTKAVRSLSWSPDGTRLVSGSFDGTARIWDAATGAPISSYTGRFNSVWAVGWAPNGQQIATAGDKHIDVWDAASGATTMTYSSHSAQPWWLAWSPDSTRIASASKDTTVHIWLPNSGADVYVYQGHTSSVNSVAWSPDGRHIASGSDDTTVQVWQAI